MKEKPPPKKPRTVEIVRSDYQPSKAELEEKDKSKEGEKIWRLESFT